MQQKEKAAPTVARSSATPIWVWAVYGLGILAASILVFSVLFTLGAYVLSNDVPVSLNVSIPALALWGGLTLAAAAVFVTRRRRR
jgi:LPXTG-motif cell wall-anchored protein